VRRSGRRDHPVGNGEPRRCGADRREQSRLRAGHPDLAAGKREPLEQGRAAARIEVRGDLVEQQDRAAADAIGDEVGMG
jgi:hypothetical protein